MIWNGDCALPTCSREAVDAYGLCRRHRYATTQECRHHLSGCLRRSCVRAERRQSRRIRLSFAWYDLWIGAFYDRHRRVLYVCPLPCVLLEWHR